jgi:Tol biopolymer transport system component
MSEAAARPIPGVESGAFGFRANPVFSPDGRSIAFWTADNPGSGEIRRVSAEGGTPVTLAKAGRPTGMSWSGDTILIGQLGIGIVRVPASGGAPDVVVRINRGESAVDPQLLPGGDMVLFTLATGFSLEGALPADYWDKAKIVVQSLKTGTRRTVVNGGSAARYLPTGHLVYAVGTTLLAVRFDLNEQKTLGAPTSVVEHMRRGVIAGLSTGAALFDVSDSGSLIYVPASSASLFSDARTFAVFDRQGGMETLKLPAARYEAPRISSPDGTRLAYDIDDGKEASVWVAFLSGARSPLRITFQGQNRFPIWSPDGQRLAFQSDRGGDRGIWWQRADGSGVAERLTTADAGTSHEPNAWSPKGDVLLYSVRTQGGGIGSLWTLSMIDKKTAMFSDGKQSMFEPTPALSPDGRWVAYTAVANGLSVVFVQPFPATGATYEISKEPDSHHPVWSRDGKELIYLNGSLQLTSVSVTTQQSFAFGNPVRVTSANTAAVTDLPFNPRNYDVMPDGKRFIKVVDADAAKRSGPQPNPTLNVVLNWTEELKQHVPSK